MTASDPEAVLRERVERSVAALPGPDRARLGAIRRGLHTRRQARSPLLWLAAAIAVALGSAATAAYVLQQQADGSSGRERAQETANDESAATMPDTEFIDSESHGDAPAHEDGDGSEPVIFRD